MREVVFMDGVCPKCGKMCGNGGFGDTLRCRCGWTGQIDPEDEKAITEIIRRNLEQDREAKKEATP